MLNTKVNTIILLNLFFKKYFTTYVHNKVDLFRIIIHNLVQQ